MKETTELLGSILFAFMLGYGIGMVYYKNRKN